MPFQIRHCLLHHLNHSSSRSTFELYYIVRDLAPLFHFQFLQIYCCVVGNMVTFHVAGYSNLTIMVDESRMMSVFKHCFCTMFTFQPFSLHISKDILNDFNNLVSSLLYQIPTTPSQGSQWVVGCGRYCIVGDNLNHNSQNTILTPRTTGSIVKIVKDKHEVLNTILQCSNALAISISIELFDSSSNDNFTPGGYLINCPLRILNVLLRSSHNLLALQVVFGLLSLASMLWHYQVIPPMSCEIWIITRYLFKKFSSC